MPHLTHLPHLPTVKALHSTCPFAWQVGQWEQVGHLRLSKLVGKRSEWAKWEPPMLLETIDGG